MKAISFLILASLAVSCATPITATSNKVGDVEGKACARNILFFIPLSLDNSIYTAAKNGNLKEISTVDQNSLYLGLYNQSCTVVHGN